MKINYKVLWVEDNKSWYKTTRGLFSEYMDDLGFILDCKRLENLSQVKEEVEKNGLSEYDLLLVDYTLKGSENGDDVISFIRSFGDHQILTEVLFYSSAIELIRDSMRKHSLEGVYSADRREIEVKFQQVVGTTIKKVQDVNAMRGLVMAETSELDDIMLEATEQFISSSAPDKSQELANYVFDKVKEFNDSGSSRLESYLKDKDIEGLIKSSLFHTMIRAKVIQKIVKLKNDQSFNDLKQFTKCYDNDVVSVRNNMAHVKEVRDSETGKTRLISHLNGKSIEFTSERCVDIRKSLIHYTDRLNELKKAIVS